MSSSTIAVVSDIHFAGAAEQARGDDYEYRDLASPWLRFFVRCHRRYVWLRNPLRLGYLLDHFIAASKGDDYIIANGDYSCDSAFVGTSDEASFASARECLSRLRQAHPGRFFPTLGDHELGKFSFFGKRGGMRLASWRRSVEELQVPPFWHFECGRHHLIGVTSSLIALPAFEAEALPPELAEWRQLREQHLREMRECFLSLGPEARVLLFLHDPTALPFLAQEEAVRAVLPRIEATVIGHLHSNLVLRQSRLLSGMPQIGFLGHTTRRLSTALREARQWRPFNVRLCPALAGIELLKDGGFYRITLDANSSGSAQFTFQPIRRN